MAGRCVETKTNCPSLNRTRIGCIALKISQSISSRQNALIFFTGQVLVDGGVAEGTVVPDNDPEALVAVDPISVHAAIPKGWV